MVDAETLPSLHRNLSTPPRCRNRWFARHVQPLRAGWVKSPIITCPHSLMRCFVAPVVLTRELLVGLICHRRSVIAAVPAVLR